MEIQGKIVELLKEQTGEGRNGTWRKMEYVLEFGDQFPKKVCFNMWGDKIDEFKVKVGDDVKVHFDIESREYNSRWYTDVKAWKIENNGGASASDLPPLPDASDAPPAGEDDLPF